MKRPPKLYDCPQCNKSKPKSGFGYFYTKGQLCSKCVEFNWPTCPKCRKKTPDIKASGRCGTCEETHCHGCGGTCVLKKSITESSGGCSCCSSDTTHNVYQCPTCKDIKFTER